MTHADLITLKDKPASVPCGTCTACCKHDRIVLNKCDDLSAFKWHQEGAQAVLDSKINGECIYLTDAGCSTHAALPDVCKRFDCRVLFLTTPKDQRRIRIGQNPSMRHVYTAGKTRADTLEA